MTLPRQVVPGRDYMITRRCSERRYFLRPDAETNNAFVYCLALAAKRANVEILFSVALSNHHHTGIHDPDGNFPVFLEHFHGLLARCQNARLGRFENLWSSEPTSVVQLTEPADVLDKMTYAFANPTAADLVDTVEEWPGFTTFKETLAGGAITAHRPPHFFRSDGDMPDAVSLSIARPKAFRDQDINRWSALVTELLRAREGEHRQRRNLAGMRVLGRAKILAQDPFASPPSQEPRFQMNPRVAAKNKWARIEALRRNRAFLESYRDAWRTHLAGIAHVLFPFGTFWMARFGKVACDAAETICDALTGDCSEPALAGT